MANDFSIDLETLGQKYNAPVIAIGVAGFDRNTGKVGPTLYVEVEIEDALKYGYMTADTMIWWMKQTDAARQVFQPKFTKLKLHAALQSMGDFLRSHGKGVPTVWGNGSSFDITVLEHAYDVGGQALEVPWKYWNIRDMRTAMDMANIDTRAYTRVGVHHNALDDAIFQAECICDAFRKVAGITLGTARIAKPVKTIPVPVEDDEL